MTITGYWNTATSLASATQLQLTPAGSPPPAAADLNLNTFMNWSTTDQSSYIIGKGGTLTLSTYRRNADGTFITMDDPADTGGAGDPNYKKRQIPKPFDVTITFNSTKNRAEIATSTLTALDVTADEFLAWSRDSQIGFIEQRGGTVLLGPEGARATVVTNGGFELHLGTTSSGRVFTTRNDMTRPALVSEFSKTPATLDPTVFLAWRPEDKLAYLLKQTTQPVTIGTAPEAITAVLRKEVSVAAGVVQRTSGDYEPLPYHYLSGSASGTPSAVVSTSAEWLFPSIDGDKTILSVSERPEEFYMTPSSLTTDAKKKQFLDSFATWNTGYQLEYIKTNGTNSFTTPTVKVLDIPAGGTTDRLTAFISPDDPTRLFIVQALDKAAIARMSLNEQNAAARAGEPVANGVGAAFSERKASLGLALAAESSLTTFGPNANGGSYTSGAAGVATTPLGYINELVNAIDGTKALNVSSTALLPAEARTAFKTQLDILKEQLANSAIVSPADIKKKVDDLRTRFNRMFAFYNVKDATEETWYHNNPDGKRLDYTVKVYADVISADGTTTTVRRGYAVFLAQEKRIAELAEARMQLVRDGGLFNGKRLDVPYLVYKFQSLYNLSLEAQVVAETEEVNQQNDLLKTYAAVQDLINKTLSAFPKADDTKKAILGESLTGTENISDAQYKVLSMFEDFLSSAQQDPFGTTRGGQLHPLEILRSLSRPTYDFFYNASYSANNPITNYDLNEYTHTQWSTYGTRLSEQVTIINQNSQIKMNDINSLDKERNRHFELANNALAKMSDILANIARIG